MFKGGEKIHEAASVFIGSLSFAVLSICWKLNTLSGHRAPNFIWGFLCSTYIVFMPSNVNHSRKEMGNSFVVKFFHKEGIIIKQGVIWGGPIFS
jgi:hypothetical protein